jgi:hypothetical protein
VSGAVIGPRPDVAATRDTLERCYRERFDGPIARGGPPERRHHEQTVFGASALTARVAQMLARPGRAADR